MWRAIFYNLKNKYIINQNQIKFILGIIVLIFSVLWYYIIIKSWLNDIGISQKSIDLISTLNTIIIAYATIINSTFSQFIRYNVKNIYDNLSILDLVGLLFGICLFIYTF